MNYLELIRSCITDGTFKCTKEFALDKLGWSVLTWEEMAGDRDVLILRLRRDKWNHK